MTDVTVAHFDGEWTMFRRRFLLIYDIRKKWGLLLKTSVWTHWAPTMNYGILHHSTCFTCNRLTKCLVMSNHFREQAAAACSLRAQLRQHFVENIRLLARPCTVGLSRCVHRATGRPIHRLLAAGSLRRHALLHEERSYLNRQQNRGGFMAPAGSVQRGGVCRKHRQWL